MVLTLLDGPQAIIDGSKYRRNMAEIESDLCLTSPRRDVTGIFTGQGLARRSGEDAEKYQNNLDTRLDAGSIAKVSSLIPGQRLFTDWIGCRATSTWWSKTGLRGPGSWIVSRQSMALANPKAHLWHLVRPAHEKW